jgi:Flp pilus assembly pilin Flp
MEGRFMALAKTRFRNLFWRRNESGTTAIEFAMFLPLLVIMLVGTVELGRAMYEAMQVNNAAEAGILWAAKNGWNSANIQSAALSASTVGGAPLTGMTAAPLRFCGCPAANTVMVMTAGACPTPPPTDCAGGQTERQYVQVTTTLPHLTIVDLKVLLAALNGGNAVIPATFTATAIVRTN